MERPQVYYRGFGKVENFKSEYDLNMTLNEQCWSSVTIIAYPVCITNNHIDQHLLNLMFYLTVLLFSSVGMQFFSKRFAVKNHKTFISTIFFKNTLFRGFQTFMIWPWTDLDLELKVMIKVIYGRIILCLFQIHDKKLVVSLNNDLFYDVTFKVKAKFKVTIIFGKNHETCASNIFL